MYQVMCDSFFPVTQLEELEEGRRKLQQRDRELSQLAESHSRVQADKERTEEELQRMKKGESWTRRSISPSSSSEEVNAVVSNCTQQFEHVYAEKYVLSPPSLLPPPSSLLSTTQAAKQYSHRERDMVVRNSELSFHVRRLEERVGSLEKIRKDLVRSQFVGLAPCPPTSSSHPILSVFPSSSLTSPQQEKLETAESQRRPLKEHNAKLSQRINDLNSTLRSQEKQMKQLAQENLVLVCVNICTHIWCRHVPFSVSLLEHQLDVHVTTFLLPPVLPEISQAAIGGGACSTAQEPQTTAKQGLTLSHREGETRKPEQGTC